MIMVFAGAGASKAVNPNVYPTTVEFFEGLPEEITGEDLFGRVTAFLGRGGEPEQPLDIEQILWALNEWRELADLARDTDKFSGWLLDRNRVRKVLSNNFDGQRAVQTFNNVDQRAERLESRINQRVYTLYERLPERTELKATWIPFLEKAIEVDARVDVFTTNYDLILESVIEEEGLPIETGRVPGLRPMLQTDVWDQARVDVESRTTGLLTKLHGSLDWIRGDNPTDIHVGTPLFTGEHQRHAIIYPGFKGAPRQKPFTYFHDYLRAVAEHATAAVFIGFAFRDEAIREVMASRIGPNVPIVVIDLAEKPPHIPFRKGQYRYLDGGFTAESGEAALDWIKKTID